MAAVRLKILLIGGVLLLGQSGRAASPASAAASSFVPGYDAETGRRSYSQHAFTRIRPGSYLKADAPFALAPDLRSETERWRDAELIRHFSRVAQLDVIAELASRGGHVSLHERAEEVRRNEAQRFADAMQQLRQTAWRKVAAVAP